MTNQEGRIQAVYPLVKPPGEVKTDFDIIASLLDAAASMAVGSSASVFEEIKSKSRLTPERRYRQAAPRASW